MVLLACAFILSVLPTVAHAQVKYRWPLGSQTAIQNYYDQNTSASYYRYDCAAIGGYNGHRGTDTGASYGAAIYAGASGSLYQRNDLCPFDGPNNADQSCGGGYGNHVRIQHTDSRVTIYAHMKYGSPAWGQSLLCTNNPGTKVGAVGSSGRSTYYHLHFELWSNSSATARIDPFSGACSQATSYWVNQNGGSPTTACK